MNRLEVTTFTHDEWRSALGVLTEVCRSGLVPGPLEFSSREEVKHRIDPSGQERVTLTATVITVFLDEPRTGPVMQALIRKLGEKARGHIAVMPVERFQKLGAPIASIA